MNSGPIALYDLSKDVAEEHDISSAHSDVVTAIELIMEREHVEDPWWPSGPHCCNSQFHPSSKPCTSG